MNRSSLKKISALCVAMVLVGSMAFAMGVGENVKESDSAPMDGGGGAGNRIDKNVGSPVTMGSQDKTGAENDTRVGTDPKSVSQAKAKKERENPLNSREYRR